MRCWKSAFCFLAPAIVGAVVLIGASDVVHAQGGLDAPVSNKPTVRTEIKRGEGASLDCFLKTLTNFLNFSLCIDAVEDVNQQKSTLSDPFKLGLYIHSLSVAERLAKADDASAVGLWRKETARIMKARKLSDKDLCSVSDMKCDVIKEIVSQAK
jgi:hypothetical protein